MNKYVGVEYNGHLFATNDGVRFNFGDAPTVEVEKEYLKPKRTITRRRDVKCPRLRKKLRRVLRQNNVRLES